MSRRLFIAAAVLPTLLAGISPVAGQATADLSVTKVDDPDPVTAGSSLVYIITVSNEGPDSADSVTLDDPLPAGTTFQSIAAPAGWSCATPAVGAGGTVSCSASSFAPGSGVFTLTVTVGSGLPAGTVLTNTATATSATPDPNPGAESASADTTVVAATTTVSITKAASPDPVVAGADLTYTITASNNGAVDLETATVTDTLPAGTTFVSLASPAGWSCTAPPAGGTGTVSCNAAPFSPGGAVFSLVVLTGSGLPGGWTLANQASLDVTDSGRSTTQAAADTTQVISPAALSGTKTVSGSFRPGGAVTYTVVLTNGSATAQGDNPGAEFSDVLPSSLVLTGATASTGMVATAANTVTWNGSLAGGASVTITIHATVGAVAAGTTVSNQGTISYDADGNGTNEASTVTDDPAAGGGADPTTFTVQQPILEVPALGGVGLAVLALLLASAGGWAVRRRALD